MPKNFWIKNGNAIAQFSQDAQFPTDALVTVRFNGKVIGQADPFVHGIPVSVTKRQAQIWQTAINIFNEFATKAKLCRGCGRQLTVLGECPNHKINQK